MAEGLQALEWRQVSRCAASDPQSNGPLVDGIARLVEPDFLSVPQRPQNLVANDIPPKSRFSQGF
jgi:hypothetical protein